MFGKNNQRFFLPLWRNGRLLFFTNYADKMAMRQNYIVAAATKPGELVVQRTQLAPVSPDDLKKCQDVANNGPELQKFFSSVGGGNLGDLVHQLDESNPFVPEKGDNLIYTCIYLDLLRKYLVDEKIVRKYETAPAPLPLNTEVSHSILKLLSSRFESERGAVLFDRDLELFDRKPVLNPAAANFLRAGAMLKSESGHTEDAEKIMLRAVKIQNSEDKWRRLGEFAEANGKDDTAIEYYNTAHALSPLPPASALLMAKLLVKTKKFGQVGPFLDIVTKTFPDAAKSIREEIART